MNNRVGQALAKVTYQLKLTNFLCKVQVFIFIDVRLKFRYKPTDSNDFID